MKTANESTAVVVPEAPEHTVPIRTKPSEEGLTTIQFPSSDADGKGGSNGAGSPVAAAVAALQGGEHANVAASEQGAAAVAKESNLPFDKEAYKWWTNARAIPSAHQPMFYVAPRTVGMLYEACKRPMVLAEAQLLVIPDGPITRCELTGDTMQAVKYLAFITEAAVKQISEGASLAEILPTQFYGGCYYFLKAEGREPRAAAFSGSKYTRNGHFRTDSPLTTWAFKLGTKSSPAWGDTLAVVEAKIKAHSGFETRMAELLKDARPPRKAVFSALASGQRFGRR